MNGYCDKHGKKIVNTAGQCAECVAERYVGGHPVQIELTGPGRELSDPKTRRREANRWAAAAVRNNTSLERLHCEGKITGEEMKALMIEVSSNLEVLLMLKELGMERGLYEDVLEQMSLWCGADWEMEERPGGLALYMEHLAKEHAG